MRKGGYRMLKQWIPAAKPDKEELDKRLDAAQGKLPQHTVALLQALA